MAQQGWISKFVTAGAVAAGCYIAYTFQKKSSKPSGFKLTNRPDPTSFANTDHVRTQKLYMNLSADFEKHIFSGYVLHTVEVIEAQTKYAVFDTHNLIISKVTDEKGAPLKYEFGTHHEIFGTPLAVTIPEDKRKKGDVIAIRIDYETMVPKAGLASAAQWLPPSQTLGKVHPYLFTQCQAIHARTIVPCQDTNTIKTPYSAHITVPKPLVALMSAISTGKEDGKDTTTYSFEQKVPTPSYLIAIAAGALYKRDIGPRSAVWCEKEMVDAGAFEFAETEDFIRHAESICGPYDWGRYDILLLPPSFPYGGMENPCLTFVTPTLIAGDRSLSAVVAHEVSHSWMGNLVSAHTWEHFWLNEGLCVFLEFKILSAMYGPAHGHLQAILGWNSLKTYMDHVGHEHPYTVLNVKLDDVDPDDCFSSVPYQKGFNLMYHLEGVVGGAKKMNPFLMAYCKEFKFRTLTSQQFVEFFNSYFKKDSDVDQKALAAVDWNTWLNKPGMPVYPHFDTSLVDSAHAGAEAIVKSGGVTASNSVDIKSWRSQQIVAFLEHLSTFQITELAEATKGGASRVESEHARWIKILDDMEKAYHFNEKKNCEVRFQWLMLCIKANVTTAFPLAVEFLTTQGRMKFVRPLYSALYKNPAGKKLAVETFKKHITFYHSIAVKTISGDLEL